MVPAGLLSFLCRLSKYEGKVVFQSIRLLRMKVTFFKNIMSMENRASDDENDFYSALDCDAVVLIEDQTLHYAFGAIGGGGRHSCNGSFCMAM